MRKNRFLTLSISALLAGWFIGCGGGSAGTGTRLYEGTVRNADGKGVSGATVTIIETQDSAITDSQGNFSIEGNVVAGDVQINVQGGTLDATVVVPNVSSEPSTVSLNIEVAPQGSPDPVAVASSNVEVVSKIVGICDPFFENLRTIRQSNETPSQVQCVARTSVKADGKTLGGVDVVVQVRRCPDGSAWRTIAMGETMHGANSGIAQIPFTFIDDEKNCVYRIIAPVGVKGLMVVAYQVDTFTKQEFDRKK